METRRARGSPAEPTGGSLTPSTVFRYRQRHSLHAFFEPKSIAVVGATGKAGGVGRTLLWNLMSNPFGGMVFPSPIRPEDEPLMVTFHETLSAHSVYLRWLHMRKLGQLVSHDELIRMCFIDYDRQMALVADYENPLTGQHEIIGVGSFIKEHSTKNAEIALLVADQFQRQGLGTEL